MMTKRYRLARQTVIISLCLIGMGAAAAFSGSPTSGPRISVEPEIFDFGFIPQDVVVSHTFWLRNTGGETANIKKVIPNCGCTRAPLVDSVIAVGDSVPVEILFGSHSYIGGVEKHVRIVSNASGRVPALTVKAQVIKEVDTSMPVAVSPSDVELQANDAGGSVEGTFTVRNTSRQVVVLEAVDLPPSGVMLDRTQATIAPGGSETFKARSGKMPSQTLEKSVTFEIRGSATARFSVPLSFGTDEKKKGTASAGQ